MLFVLVVPVHLIEVQPCAANQIDAAGAPETDSHWLRRRAVYRAHCVLYESADRGLGDPSKRVLRLVDDVPGMDSLGGGKPLDDRSRDALEQCCAMLWIAYRTPAATNDDAVDFLGRPTQMKVEQREHDPDASARGELHRRVQITQNTIVDSQRLTVRSKLDPGAAVAEQKPPERGYAALAKLLYPISRACRYSFNRQPALGAPCIRTEVTAVPNPRQIGAE
jgi:hypothetical protein